MNETMTKYALIRVSSFDQKEKGLSIEVQRERMLALGIPEENIFCDAGKSGGLHEDDLDYSFKEGRYFIIKIDLQPREQFRTLIGKLQEGDEVYFTKHDRVSRRNAFLDFFHTYCEGRGVKLFALDESNDRLTRRILSVIGEEELLKTAHRNNAIQESIYNSGGWPYKSVTGYVKNAKVGNTLKFPDKPANCLIINEAEAARVRNIFTRMAAGEPYDAICLLHDISHGTLYAIIRNRVYRGETHLGDNDWKPTPLIPALVDEATFKAANANIRIRPKRGERA
jgi:DNA invertase Pin-like site-specific DNA recombinase